MWKDILLIANQQSMTQTDVHKKKQESKFESKSPTRVISTSAWIVHYTTVMDYIFAGVCSPFHSRNVNVAQESSGSQPVSWDTTNLVGHKMINVRKKGIYVLFIFPGITGSEGMLLNCYINFSLSVWSFVCDTNRTVILHLYGIK